MEKSRAARAPHGTNDAVPKMACGHRADGPVWVLADPTLFGREMGLEIKQCMTKDKEGIPCSKLISISLITPTIAGPGGGPKKPTGVITL